VHSLGPDTLFAHLRVRRDSKGEGEKEIAANGEEQDEQEKEERKRNGESNSE
jgi:hypothetical protein